MIQFETKNLSEAVETFQTFILEDSIPMPEGTVCMISAKGGTGKTNLSLLIASEFIKNHQGMVALWLTEDDEGNVKHRINTLLKHEIIESFNQERVELIVDNPIHFAKTKGNEFISDIDSFDSFKAFCCISDIRLLILDPLLAFFGGNENDNAQARTFMQPFINWCKEVNITIILIHHSSKGETNTRGAGAFSDAVRCAYTISMPIKEENKHIVEDEYKSAQGIRTIKCTKDNRGVMELIYKKYGENPFNFVLAPSLDNIFLEKIKGIVTDKLIANIKTTKKKIECEIIEYKEEEEKKIEIN